MARLTHHAFAAAACTVAAAVLTTAPAAGGSVQRVAEHTRHRHHHPAHRRPRAPAQCAAADAQVASSSLPAMRSAVVCLVNQQRTRRGLPALAASAQLDSSAQSWTQAMVLTGQFTHGPGDAFARRISATGYVWQTAGENIAAGFSTPRSVVAGWMASTDHCRNMLNPSFRDVGTGESDSPVRPYGGGSWTQDFGLRIGQVPRSRNQGPMNGCPY